MKKKREAVPTFIPDADWKRFATPLKIPDEARPAFEDAVQMYRGFVIHKGETNAARKKQLLKFKDQLDDIIASAARLDVGALMCLFKALGLDLGNLLTVGNILERHLARVIFPIQTIKDAAQKAAFSIPKARPGQHSDSFWLEVFVGRLDLILEAYTGTALKNSNCPLAFACALGKLANPELSDRRVQSAVASVVKERRRLNTSPPR